MSKVKLPPPVKVPRLDVEEMHGISRSKLNAMRPAEFRDMCRRGEWTDVSVLACHGHVVTNLAIVPREYAFEFLLFCNRNPRPCPVLDVTEPGDPHPKILAPNADIRTDLPRYRVIKNGKIIDEPTDIIKYWRNDLVCFLIGCSQNIDFILRTANVNYRMVGTFITNIPLVPAGHFYGNHMICSSRLFKTSYDAVRGIQISSRHPAGHGPPIYIGDAARIGIKDLSQPDIAARGEPPQEPSEIAMFWGCGITPQSVAMEAEIPFLISHGQGTMFIADTLIEELAII